MATDTEPPPAATPPPWHRDLQPCRRREGRAVAPARPAPPPPPPLPPPTPPAPAPRDTAPDPSRPASRYIDAFGEIVGLPSPRGPCEEAAAAPPPDAAAEDLQYGPGIVSRLRSRYLSMAQRQTTSSVTDPLRRAASLQDILRREGAFERGAVQDSYLLAGRSALTAPAAWGESIRKTKSVGDLVSPPPGSDGPGRPAPSDSGGRVPTQRGSGAEKTVSAGSVGVGEKKEPKCATEEKTDRTRGTGEKILPVKSGEKIPAVTSDSADKKIASSEGANGKPVRKGGDAIQEIKLSSCEKLVNSASVCEKAEAVKSGEKTPPVSSGGTCNKPVGSLGKNAPVVRPREKTPKTNCAGNGSTSGGSKAITTSAKPTTTKVSPVTSRNGPIPPPAAMKADSGGPQVVPRPLQDARLTRENSLPAVDTVSTVRRLFEHPSGGGGGGRGAPPEKGAQGGGGGRPGAADAPLAAGADDVAAAPAGVMAASDIAGGRRDTEGKPRDRRSPPPAARQVGVIRPNQTPPAGDQGELERRHNALNSVRNGHPPITNGQSIAPPLKAKNMVNHLLNGSRTGWRSEQTIVTGPVMKGGPLTKASLAAEVRRSSPPPGSVQAVNSRLISAAPETPSPARESVPTTNGVTQPSPVQTATWHQQAKNSTSYNFTDRRAVPDYIEDDGMDIHRPAKPKPSDTGYVLLPGFEPGQTSDDDLLVVAQLDVPLECPVAFSNAGVIINGHSSLRRQPREGARIVSFSEARPAVYRYPSESSLLDGEPGRAESEPRRPESEPSRSESDPAAEDGEDESEGPDGRPASHSRLTDTAPEAGPAPAADPVAKPSTLSTYTSSRLSSAEAETFQLGVTRLSRPPPPSIPAPEPPSAPTPAPTEGEEVLWSAGTTADMLF